MIADISPEAAISNIPINIPKNPTSWALVSAPCINEWPNDVIGTYAPGPTNLIILSYILKVSKNAPIITNKLIQQKQMILNISYYTLQTNSMWNR